MSIQDAFGDEVEVEGSVGRSGSFEVTIDGSNLVFSKLKEGAHLADYDIVNQAIEAALDSGDDTAASGTSAAAEAAAPTDACCKDGVCTMPGAKAAGAEKEKTWGEWAASMVGL